MSHKNGENEDEDKLWGRVVKCTLFIRRNMCKIDNHKRWLVKPQRFPISPSSNTLQCHAPWNVLWLILSFLVWSSKHPYLTGKPWRFKRNVQVKAKMKVNLPYSWQSYNFFFIPKLCALPVLLILMNGWINIFQGHICSLHTCASLPPLQSPRCVTIRMKELSCENSLLRTWRSQSYRTKSLTKGWSWLWKCAFLWNSS